MLWKSNNQGELYHLVLMVAKIHQDIRLNIIETDLQEVRISKYLRGTSKIKPHIMEAVTAYWYPIALAEELDSSDEEVEMALLDSLRILSAQMTHLVDYQRVKRKINLPAESLMRFGLLPISQSLTTPPATVVTSPVLDAEDDEDDTDEWVMPSAPDTSIFDRT
jgi:hypothetical protein